MVIRIIYPLMSATNHPKNDKGRATRLKGWANTGRYGRALTTMIPAVVRANSEVEGML